MFKPLSDIHDVAVIRLDEIGDLVLTSPFLRELRRNLPYSHISLAVNPLCLNLVERCPYVDQVICVSTQKRGGGWGEIGHAAALLDQASRQWWQRQYDLAILPRYGPDTHAARLIAWLTRASWRIGFEEPVSVSRSSSRLGLSADRLLTQRLPRSGVLHEALRNLTVLKSIGGNIAHDRLELWTDEEDARVARMVLDNGGANLRPSLEAASLVAICPAGRHPCKKWPIARFAAVIERLLAMPSTPRIVLIGGPNDRLLVRPLCAEFGNRVLDLVGKLTLRQTAAVLRHCDLYLGCDTGPMHMAAAAGASVVEICCHPLGGDPAHENSPSRFGPWKTPAMVLQPYAVSPCNTCCVSESSHCILEISVDEVADAASRLLESRSLRRGQTSLPAE